MHRGRILCLFGTIPLAVLNFFLHPFLMSLGVEEEVADYARIYGAFLFIAVSFHYQFDCYRLYLNSVGETKVLSFVCLFTSIIHIFACYILTVKLNFGVMGVAISTMMTLFNNCLLVTLYSWLILDYHVSPCPPSIRSLLQPEDLRLYLSISLPSMVMMMAEWISVELLIIMSGSISIGAVGAMSVSYAYFNLIYQIPYGIQAAITATVGNWIGEGNEKAAKLTALMGIMYSNFITSLVAYFTYAYAYEISTTYSSDIDTIALLVPVMKASAVAFLFNGFA